MLMYILLYKQYYILYPFFSTKYVKGLYNEDIVEKMNNSSLSNKFITIKNPSFIGLTEGKSINYINQNYLN